MFDGGVGDLTGVKVLFEFGGDALEVLRVGWVVGEDLDWFGHCEWWLAVVHKGVVCDGGLLEEE